MQRTAGGTRISRPGTRQGRCVIDGKGTAKVAVDGARVGSLESARALSPTVRLLRTAIAPLLHVAVISGRISS
jgi:hypothetical protein